MLTPAAQNLRIRKPAKASAVQATWPGTTVVKSTSTPFNWQGQPSAIVAADPSMRAKKTSPKPAPIHIHGLSKKADKRMRDNAANPGAFNTPIQSQEACDKTRRIRFSAGSAA